MYRRINDNFWKSRDVAGLVSNELLVFLYLITSPHSHVSGLYWVPQLYIATETKLPATEVASALLKLSSPNKRGNIMADYDPDRQIVFVRKMLRYQGSSPKLLVSAVNQLKGLGLQPDSPMAVAFIGAMREAFPAFEKQYGSEYPFDTVSIPSRLVPSVSVSDSVSVSGTVSGKSKRALTVLPTPEPKRSKRATPPGAVAKRVVHEYEAISGWKAVPAAYRSCQKKIDDGEGSALMAAADAYAAKIRDEETEKKFRTQPHNWFGKQAKYLLYVPTEKTGELTETIAIGGMPNLNEGYDDEPDPDNQPEDPVWAEQRRKRREHTERVAAAKKKLLPALRRENPSMSRSDVDDLASDKANTIIFEENRAAKEQGAAT